MFYAMDIPVEPPKPRVREILKQFPRVRHANERTHEEPRSQQKKGDHQNVPEGVMLEVDIHDLEPLQILNAYRRKLGLGPSLNLISSSIYDCDPTTIAECYERTITGGFSGFPHLFSPTQHQVPNGSPQSSEAPVDSSTISECDMSSSSSSYQHETSDEYSSDTRPSTSQHSSDKDSVHYDRDLGYRRISVLHDEALRHDLWDLMDRPGPLFRDSATICPKGM
ncbi:hypothetical protein F4859DRAFT_489637 [Xylaria cf. heliscus]|nr:hypothetical protein F4859DRAFT_489637 [Xylaria cf. heliscus]